MGFDKFWTQEKRKTQPQGNACWVRLARARSSFPDGALTSNPGGWMRSGRVLMADYLIGLWAFLTLNDVKFYFVAFFQTFVTINLDGTVVHKNVWSIIASDKAISLCVVEPFHLAFVLRHEPCPSLGDRLRLGDRASNLPVVRDADWGGLVFFGGLWMFRTFFAVRRRRCVIADEIQRENRMRYVRTALAAAALLCTERPRNSCGCAAS
jgi:hypothetical protein